MPKSDLEGLNRAGVAARIAGQSYYDNPMFFSTVQTDMPEQLLHWHDLCLACAAGWMREDAGRDEALHRVLRVRYLCVGPSPLFPKATEGEQSNPKNSKTHDYGEQHAC